MDRLESMSVLISVTELGSLSAASRKLGMPLATVSRKISELEAHLNAKLLNRSTRKIELTDVGRAYLVVCKRVLEDLTEAERTVSGEYRAPKGDLVITAPIVFGRIHVLPIVTEFLKIYPDINIQLLFTDRVVDMLEEHVDLAARIGDLPDSQMIATRVGLIRQVVCGSPEYFAKHGTPKTPKELSDHDCVSLDDFGSTTAWSFPRGPKSTTSVSVHSRLVVSTAEAAHDAAVAGIGITRLLSYQTAKSVDAGKLQIILKDFEPAPWPANLVYRGGRVIPLKLRAFLDYSVPRLKRKI